MYTSPPAVVQLHTTNQFVGINLPGLVPSYSNLNNMNFQGSYHIRCYRFPQNYYNFYPGDKYYANIAYTLDDELSSIVQTNQFVLFESRAYQQLTGHELVSAFNDTLNSKLGAPDASGLTPMDRIQAQEVEVEIRSQHPDDGSEPDPQNDLTPTEIAFVAFDRLCTLTFDETSSKITLRFDMVHDPVLTGNNVHVHEDFGHALRVYTSKIKQISLVISVDNSTVPATQAFLKRAVGIAPDKLSCEFIVTQPTIARSQFINHTSKLLHFNDDRRLSTLDISINVYNRLVSDMRRHLNVLVRSTMQSNLWSTEGNRLNTIRMFPFSGQVGRNEKLTHIDSTDTPSHIEVTDLRRAEIEVCDGAGQPILFLEPYHIELGIVFTATRN